MKDATCKSTKPTIVSLFVFYRDFYVFFVFSTVYGFRPFWKQTEVTNFGKTFSDSFFCFLYVSL